MSEDDVDDGFCHGGRRSVEVVYLVTSMPMVSVAPLQVAAGARGHWAIENRLHCLRDVTFDEDRSAVRTAGTGPQVPGLIWELRVLRARSIELGIGQIDEDLF